MTKATFLQKHKATVAASPAVNSLVYVYSSQSGFRHGLFPWFFKGTKDGLSLLAHELNSPVEEYSRTGNPLYIKG